MRTLPHMLFSPYALYPNVHYYIGTGFAKHRTTCGSPYRHHGIIPRHIVREHEQKQLRQLLKLRQLLCRAKLFCNYCDTTLIIILKHLFNMQAFKVMLSLRGLTSFRHR